MKINRKTKSKGFNIRENYFFIMTTKIREFVAN